VKEVLGSILEIDGKDINELSNSSLTNLSLLQRARDLCEYRSPIRELSSFNEQNFASDLLSDELAHFEDLDEACQVASQQSSERHTELSEAAMDDIRELFDLIDSIKNQVVLINAELNRLDIKQETIDNT
jgi:hypothetical protein